MKKNLLKRIGAVALALAVSLTMGVSAYAVDLPAKGLTGTPGTDAGNTITLKKGIVFVNAGNKDAYEPNISYSYGIAKASPSATTKITDVDGNVATVKAGPASGALLGANVSSGVTSGYSLDITAGADPVSTSSAGVEKQYNIPIVIDLTKFSSAGVYRYKITESVTDAALEKAAITRSNDYTNVRYLDVYVQNGSNGLEVYGYVCFDGKDTDSFDGKTAGTADLASKTQGFVKDNDATAGDLQNVDVYYTYNFTVKKDIEGTLADMEHKFPFEFTTGNADTAAKYTFVPSSGSADAVAKTFSSADATISASLGEQEKVEFWAVPATATFKADETQDLNDTYKVKIEFTGSHTAVTEAEKAQNEHTVTDATAVSITSDYAARVATTAAAAEVFKDVTYTNTLTAISPTNVVMRFAPYLFILGAAIVLLVLMRRRRASQDAE